jgi:putative sterol carrier protein
MAGVPSIMMATIEECRAALEELAQKLASAHAEVRQAAATDRSVSCHLTDLDTTFTGRLTDSRIELNGTEPGPPKQRADIRLAMSSDDLVAMVDGKLSFPKAWATGRVRLEAGLRDLIRLTNML